MKTPNEIKKGLKHCVKMGCAGCPYDEGCMSYNPFRECASDAYDYIQQLEADATTFYDKAAATKAKVQKDYEGFVDVIHALADQIPQWISAKERLPENSLRALVRVIHSYNHTDGYADIAMSYFEDGHWTDIPPKYYDVTHWMPLPEPPEDE